MTKYEGIYRAKAVAVDGPRLVCYVPQVFGDQTITISRFVNGRPTETGMGWVFFEGGLADHPVWGVDTAVYTVPDWEDAFADITTTLIGAVSNQAVTPAGLKAALPFIDSVSYGLVGNGVTDDTAALQAFLNDQPTRTHYLRTPSGGKYRTTNTLTVPYQAGYHLLGESRWTTLIELDGNNKPVLVTTGQWQHRLTIEHLGLGFKTRQPIANTAAVGLGFQGIPGTGGTGGFWNTFRHLNITNAQTGLKSLSGGQGFGPWNYRFEDIEFVGTTYQLVSFNMTPDAISGMPVSVFSHIVSLGAPLTGAGTAVNIDGEFILDGLDVEDWAGPILYSAYGNGSIRSCHIERHSFPGDYQSMFALGAGSYMIDNYNLNVITASPTGHALFTFDAGARAKMGYGSLTLDAAGASIALLRTGDPTVIIDLVEGGPTKVGVSAYARYYPWEATPGVLTTNAGSATWDPASVAAGAMTSTTVTVDGAAIGDVVAVGFSQAIPAGVVLSGAVTAANTITVTIVNHTGSAVDLASGTVTARMWKNRP